MRQYLAICSICALIVCISCQKNNDLLSPTDNYTQNQDSIINLQAFNTNPDSIDLLSIGSLNNQSELKSAISGIYKDWSGKVIVEYFYATSGPAQHNDNAIAHVDPEYVCIGGGAFVDYNGVGALIVDSYPTSDKSGWQASSKDHLEKDINTLYVYAIGLRLEGVSHDELKNRISIFTRTSSTVNHPNTYYTMPGNYDLIGGGADIHYKGTGNMLVHTYPSGSTWYVKGKDHKKAAPSSITVYAIGIKKGEIPGFGYLDFNISSSSNYTSYGASSTTTSIPSGWVVACPGAKATFNGTGRMLYGIKPYGNSVTVSSKDHLTRDSGYTEAYALRIRKRP